MLIMSGILFAEFMIVGQNNGRLSWPYGDLTPGNYLAKAGLPLFCVLVALAVSERGKVGGLAALVSMITIVASVLSGERINFILRAMGGMLAGVVYRPIWPRYLLLVAAEIAAIAGVFLLKPGIGDRFVTSFLNQLPVYETSPYKRVWNGVSTLSIPRRSLALGRTVIASSAPQSQQIIRMLTAIRIPTTSISSSLVKRE